MAGQLKTKTNKRLFWGLFVISVLFHGVVLNLPWPRPSLSSESQVSIDERDERLDNGQSEAISTVSLSDLDLLPEKSEKRAASDVPAPSPVNAQQHHDTAVVAPSAQPVQVQPAQQPIPQPVQTMVQLPVEQRPVQPSSTQPLPDSAESTSPSKQSSKKSSDDELSSSPASIETDPTQGMVMQLGKDFPDLAGAQSGCYGLAGCRQLSGNYRQAARQLIEQMKAMGYQLTERSDIDGAGHRVFEAIAPDKPNETYYLNIFSPDVGSTVYVMAADILSLEELKKLSG